MSCVVIGSTSCAPDSGCSPVGTAMHWPLGEVHHAPSIAEAVHDIHRAVEALERNPNEALLLQALLLELPSLAA